MYVATLQIILDPDAVPEAPIENEAAAADAIHGLMETNRYNFDWSYLKIGAQIIGPSEIFINPDTYEEGQAFGN